MSHHEHKSGADLARALLKALNERDVTTYKSLMTPDCQYQILPTSLGQPVLTPDVAATHLLNGFLKLVPDFQVRYSTTCG
jgi:hypothetical protein